VTQIGILSGVYSKAGVDIEAAYPKNFEPVAEDSGVSKGYLRPIDGVDSLGTGPGGDRAGIVWKGVHYRIMGSNLVSVSASGTVLVLGDVGGSGYATLSYSFDNLIIVSGGNLFYYNGSLTQVTDPDLGLALDGLWVDGYTMTTDGTFVVITELNAPYAVNPLKYGSAEEDPDPIIGLIKIRSSPYVCNRHTIEVLQNVGGNGFPFAKARGAMIPKGIVGVGAKCLFLETAAFVGGGRDEGVGVHLIGSGQAIKISSRALDKALAELDDAELSDIQLESRQGNGSALLFVHLPAETWCYTYSTSQALDIPVWFRLGSGAFGDRPYRPRNYTIVDNSWYCGDIESNAIGRFNAGVTTQFGEDAGGEFATLILYNEGRGVIIHQMELVTQSGRAEFGERGTVFLSFSDDNLLFGPERAVSYGEFGGRTTRPVWFGCGLFRNRRIARFRVQNNAPVAFLRLEATMEPLNG
jgi:hypothetical protein